MSVSRPKTTSIYHHAALQRASAVLNVCRLYHSSLLKLLLMYLNLSMLVPIAGDLAFNIGLGFTIVALPLTIGAIARTAFIKYRFTDKRVSVTTSAPWECEFEGSLPAWEHLTAAEMAVCQCGCPQLQECAGQQRGKQLHAPALSFQ